MKTFTIDNEDKAAAWGSGAEAEQNTAPEAVPFSTIEELRQMTQEWPLARLVAMWNGLPGVTPLIRFTNRKTAVARIWKTLQKPIKPTKASPGVSAKDSGSRRKKMLARAGSKKAQILSLLKQPRGATLLEIMRATGWQAHSVRGFISGSLVKRMGLKISSARRSGGERGYQIMRVYPPTSS